MVGRAIPEDRGERVGMAGSMGLGHRRICVIDEALGSVLGSKSPQQLFCKVLGYPAAEGAISTDGYSHREREPLAADPILFATAGTGGALRLIHLRLAGDRLPHDGARPAIQRLLREHPLSVIVITAEGAEGWQLVWGLPGPEKDSPVLRRITLDPSAPLRAVAGRVALLDLCRLGCDPAEADAAQLRWLVRDAFDLEGMRRQFLKAHDRQLGLVERSLEWIDATPDQRRGLALRLIRRLMVEAFVRCTGRTGEPARELLAAGRGLQGGEILHADVEADVQRALVDEFPFTATEGASVDREVAIDPEMLGIVYEARAPGRRERGSFYTPAHVVEFMVKEALRDYLRRTVPGATDSAVDRLLAEGNPAGLRDPQVALHALRRVKVCDPSCGSGAFLMGMLRELMELRDCLADPFPLHLRHLEILLNNLYGVELDPSAAEIARLRLNLALMSGCAPQESPPVPDLDLQICVGDGLTGPNPEGGLPKELEERLPFRYARTKVRWALAGNGAKADLEERLAKLRMEFLLGLRAGKPAVGFDWSLELPELFVCGGFDVVLMNPPYLGASRVPGDRRGSMRDYLKSLKPVYGFTGDLYVHFFHRALQLLKPGGTLSALTSGSFLTNSTKEPLRRELLRHTIRLLMPLGSRLFPATVYPAVTILEKGRSGDNPYDILFANGREGETGGYGVRRLSTEAAVSVSSREYESGFGAIFFQPTPENRRLFDVLLAGPWPVNSGGREFLPLGKVAPALDTGIHSGNVRSRLFFAEQPPGRVLPRLLQGTQLLRYGVWWDNPEARYSYVDVDYRSDLARMGTGRGGRPSGRKEYWRFSGAQDNHMVRERLLLRQTADEPFAGYIRQGNEVVYTDNTLHTLLLAEEGIRRGLTYGYLLALLNSGTLRWIYRAVAQERGRTLPQVKTGLVNRLPIALPRAGEQRELEALVAEIQAIQSDARFPLPAGSEGRIAALQSQIDQKVAALYGY